MNKPESLPPLGVDPLLARLRQDVQSMHAYAVQDARGLIKLDAMENPHRLSAELQAELGARLGALALNRYPGQELNVLKQALANHIQMPAGYSLMLGNGSDELISLLAMACDVPGATLMAPVPGFVMYAMSAQLQGLRFVGVPLTAQFELDAPAMVSAIAEHHPALVYLAYPNNPTANLWDDAAMEQVVLAQGAHGGLVVVDEAYQPFASKNYQARMQQHPHVLLLRTLSKFGLAGVRLGYLLGRQSLIEQIDKLRPPYNISVLNCEAALFALEHEAVFAAQATEIRAQRQQLMAALQQLTALPGVSVYPSEANMILLRVPDAAACFAALKARGVLVKNVSTMHPLLSNCLRLTVGTAAENAQLLAALKASL